MKTSQSTSGFIKVYHQSKGNCKLALMWVQIMHNNTHVGTNNVALVSTHTDPYGQTHHSSNPTVLIFIVCLMGLWTIALFAALFTWCCKGAIGRWSIRFGTRQNREQLRSSPQNPQQYAIDMDQIHSAWSSIYPNRHLSSVPEIQ